MAKKIFIAVLAVLLFGCRQNDLSENDPDPNGVTVSKYTTPKQYTAGALAKMKSLAQTGVGEKEVRINGTYQRTEYEVIYRSNGRCTSYGYAFYTARNKRHFKSLMVDIEKELKNKLVEVNHTDYYYCIEYGSWQTELNLNLNIRNKNLIQWKSSTN
jgi:hypothetical protein